MNIYEVGKTVRVRRLAVGLTQQRLAKLAGLSRQTVQQLEAGTIGDLSFGRLVNLLRVLGLNFAPPSIKAREKKNGLWIAAKNASVSYRGELTSDQLMRALTTGKVPDNHIISFNTLSRRNACAGGSDGGRGGSTSRSGPTSAHLGMRRTVGPPSGECT